jgi:hypothetical protein
MYCDPSAGNTMRKIGPNKAAPPIPDEIEQVATHTQVGNMNQYLLKSIKENISEKPTTLAVFAVDDTIVVAAEISGVIWSNTSGFNKSRTAGELSNIRVVTGLLRALPRTLLL